MKSLVCLLTDVMRDAGRLCAVNIERDINTVTRRSQSEGESFLTSTLPMFLSAFEQSLENGNIASVPFPHFRKRGGYPLFLGGMLRRVFSSDGTTVLVNADSSAVQAVRQICGFFGKIFEVCPDTRVQASIDGFHECEDELKELWFDPALLDSLAIAAARYFGSELSAIDKACHEMTLVPRHGPGATADALRGNAKFDCRVWTQRLEKEAPACEYLVPFRSEASNACVQFLEPWEEHDLKVVAVPKTANKARLIAIEPTYRQWAQQALLGAFAREFHKGSRTIDLTDQSANRLLARSGSEDGGFATLDLSEASDRVHLAVVNAVFNRFPHLRRFLMASRGTIARTADGRRVRLRKFASMGSAVCFPVESIVFATIAMHSIEQAANRSSYEAVYSVHSLRSMVRVFGDDIVVPTRYAVDVIHTLVALGNKPNPNKSFWRGSFRESCGGDYFRGDDVTIARLRKRLPESRRDDAEILSLIALRNHLYERGYWGAVQRLDDRLAVLRVPMPIVEEGSPIAGRKSFCFSYQTERHDPDLQHPLVRGLLVTSRPPRSFASGWGAVMKCTVSRRVEPFADPLHLLRSGRPNRVRTKVGMGRPF